MVASSHKKETVIDLTEEQDSDIEVLETDPQISRQIVKKRGRPPGSRNRSTTIVQTSKRRQTPRRPVFQVPLGDWPRDVVFVILEKCPPTVLVALCRTSKDMRDLCIPFLYREINIKWYTSRWKSYYREQKSIKALLARQITFCNTIIRHREYAFHARDLSWTLGFSRGAEEEHKIYTAFRLMRGVKKIELRSSGSAWYYRPYYIPSNNLFPELKYMTVVGFIPWKLLRSLLFISKHDDLETLILRPKTSNLPHERERFLQDRGQTLMQYTEQVALQRFPKLDLYRIEDW